MSAQERHTIDTPLEILNNLASPPTFGALDTTVPIVQTSNSNPTQILSRRHGIERIDGLLLHGRNSQIYEVNIETPGTIEQIYRKHNTFVEDTSVPQNLEEFIKDSFVEGDWDSDDDKLHDELTTGKDSRSSRYQKSLKSKPITSYTPIRSIEYLNHVGKPQEVVAYGKFRDYLGATKETLRQQLASNPDSRPNNAITLPPPKHAMLEYHPSDSVSQIVSRQFEAQSVESVNNNNNNNNSTIPTPPTIHEILPDPKHVPQLSKNIEEALTFRPNNHSMFCLSIRNITDVFNNHTREDGVYYGLLGSTPNNGIKFVDSSQFDPESDHSNSNNTQTNKNAEAPESSTSMTLTPPTTSTQQQQQQQQQQQRSLDDICGIAFCRVISSQHIVEWIEKGQREPLSRFITENQLKKAEKEQEIGIGSIQCGEIKQDSMQIAHQVPTKAVTASINTVSSCVAPIGPVQDIPTATPEELKSFLQSTTLHKPSYSTTPSSSSVVFEELPEEEGEDSGQKAQNQTGIDDDVDEIAVYYPIVQLPDDDDDDGDGDGAEEGEPNPQMNNKEESNSKQLKVDSPKHFQAAESVDETPPETDLILNTSLSAQNSLEKLNADSIGNYHWVKIELISLLSEHRSKGVGNLLFIATLLAGSLSQRFHHHHHHHHRDDQQHHPQDQINNAILSLAGGSQDNARAGKLYEQHGFVPVPPSYFHQPNRDLYVLLSINRVFKKIHWDDLIAGLHSLE